MGGLGRGNQAGTVISQWQLFRRCTLIGDSLVGVMFAIWFHLAKVKASGERSA